MRTISAFLILSAASWPQGEDRAPVTARIRAASPGRAVLTVTNHGGFPLTALAYGSGNAADPFDPAWMFCDAAMGQFEPVPRGRSAVLSCLGPPTPDAGATVAVAAGVFAGGSSFGDPALVSRIERRRQYMLSAMEEIVALMKREMAEGKKKNEITAELRSTLSQKLQEAAGADQGECLRSVYEPSIRAVTETLRDAPMPVLPYTAMRRQIADFETRRAILLTIK